MLLFQLPNHVAVGCDASIWIALSPPAFFATSELGSTYSLSAVCTKVEAITGAFCEIDTAGAITIGAFVAAGLTAGAAAGDSLMIGTKGADTAAVLEVVVTCCTDCDGNTIGWPLSI